MTTVPNGELAEVFAKLARQLQAEDTPRKVQERVTRAAVDTVDGCDHAAISLVHRRGGIETVAATDDVPPRVDAIQYEAGQGPCLDALIEHGVFPIDDLANDKRWPSFSRRTAEETGVRSMLSLRLFLEGDTIGALNMYSRTVQAFDEQACAVGTILAAHAAIAMQAAREHAHSKQLDHALESNREIGMAMGVLMAQGRMTQNQAFEALRQASQHLNRKLHDVAAELVETGQLPQPPASPPSK
ncbi:GAF and ANTAR domain-containing protein [Pseudonocardia charpentierae]|uniref:GAF and ANTAR domain-containing protein n=1 Tax=Pseudonocardia charpentierae TaxID=3075545 RepID=A0ABU2NF74_9PSEU|nr:GAF and ANTAR domain-containing protein [Pseudonocardia sp. DSM 45834]MDT0352607.1 GAF and ANTAR domain-containing protein [Pseudonocardia sp. DSM 45834]